MEGEKNDQGTRYNGANIAEQVLKLQIPSYQSEAKLIHFFELPPLKDTVESLQHCREIFYGCFIKRELAGVISFKKTKNVLDIHRLFVSPAHFRKGIASSLIRFVETFDRNIYEILVATAANNTPAVKFYLKNGYVETGKHHISDQLSLSVFKKIIR